MSMTTNSRFNCYFGCKGGTLHHFPKLHDTERFNAWKAVLNEELKEKEDQYIYNQSRLCNKHFENYYISSSGRLTRNAIPTLLIKKDTDSDSTAPVPTETCTVSVPTAPAVLNTRKGLKRKYEQDIMPVVQCQRCQQYGHSKNYCMRPYRFVKCAESHKTLECPKDRNTPAICALCQRAHSANFKGCEAYREILARKTNQYSSKPRPVREKTKFTEKQVTKDEQHPQSVPRNETKVTKDVKTTPIQTNTQPNPTKEIEIIYLTNTQEYNPQHHRTKPEQSNKLTDPLTYSKILTKNTSQEIDKSPTTIEQILAKQMEKVDQILDQMSVLINLVTKLIDKLS